MIAKNLLHATALGLAAWIGWAGHSPATAQERPYPLTEERAPCKDYDPLRRPHFGDTHVHTAYSFDASTQDTRNTPYDAYDFAKGRRMGIQPYDGDKPLRQVRLDRPLDFTAVTDHAEFMGEIEVCMTPGSDGYWHPVCITHRHFPSLSFATFGARGMIMKQRWGFCAEGACDKQLGDVWGRVRDATEKAYDRSADCSFTSFVGYEWTGTVGSGKNLHHNVIFRNGKVPERPLSWIDSPSSVALWDYLEKSCVEDIPGCDAVFIPHNSNLSAGLMFETARVSGDFVPQGEVTAKEARRRARWEPLMEMYQHKGDSECDSRLGWEEDELCGFEKLDYDDFGTRPNGFNNIAVKMGIWFSGIDDVPGAKLPEPNNYVRWALGEGLRQQARLGANAFKFGLIASTDTHIAAPGLTSEVNHPGHGGAGMGAKDGVPTGLPDNLEYSPGGLAVLYAEENTRDSLFAAMQRREAYGTSGTRPVVRFFGGWNYPDNLCDRHDMVARGYAGGVPMGGDLPPRGSASAAPRFVVAAWQDPGTGADAGSALQRLQVIKGWYENGEARETVYDVVGGDRRASVDKYSCEQQGNGYDQLCTVWQDPDFNPQAQAFYYTRVVENPSCRWSQRICNAAGVRCDNPETVTDGLEGCCAAEHRPIINERAWSSPIWHTP